MDTPIENMKSPNCRMPTVLSLFEAMEIVECDINTHCQPPIS